MKALTILAAMGLLFAGCTGAGPAPTVADRLDSLFAERYADSDSAPGGAVLIAKGDSVIYERYFGVADMATGERITDSTLFNIASVSKQFTVAAMLQQLGDSINVPVSRYFDFPQKFWDNVTLAHLASHTSGVPDSRDRSDRMRCVLADDSVSFAYFPYVDSLKFEPGTAYDYLNPSFIILAKVVEQLSGEEFCEYQRRHIFAPLGMDATVYFSPDTMPAHTAHGYEPTPGGWAEYDYGEETFFATRPDGGIYSNPRDMLRWERGLATGKVVPGNLLRMAYTPRVSVTDSPWCDYQRRPHTSYGLGWFIDNTPGRPVKVYHTGDNGGFQAYVAKYPTEDISIIVLENRHDRDRWQMAAKIDQILFD